MDPKFPGLCENIVPLGECLNGDVLYEKRQELLPLFNANSLLHKKASRLIKRPEDCLTTALPLIADAPILTGRRNLPKSWPTGFLEKEGKKMGAKSAGFYRV